MVKYMVIDTETNSLDKKNAYIIELAWVVYDDITKKIEKTSLLLDIPVEIHNTHIHNISKEMTLNSYKFDEIIDIFLEDYKECDKIIGHNLQFDLHMIEVELDRNCMYEKIDILYNKLHYDTMINSVNVCKIIGKNNRSFKFPRLSELYNFLFGKEFEGGHRALKDCIITLECYNRLQELIC
jgi:DNA polymerase III epsilon subunit-like protein